jgi:hypothetical protein
MLLTLVVAVGIGVWLAATAIYRSDDYWLVAEGWAGGSLTDALSQWFTKHAEPRTMDSWPKFYRPVWLGLMIVDAHLLGAIPALSALLSWALHCATAWMAGHIAFHLTRSASCRWLATWVCLLPAAGLQAVVWVAARGDVLAALFTLLGIGVAISARRTPAARLVAMVLLVWLAAGSNEVGLVAGPLIVGATMVAPRENDTLPRWAVWLGALVPMVLWLLWRRMILQAWLGGYGQTHGVGPLWARMASTVGSGTGAVMLASDGTMTLHVVQWSGIALLLLLFGCTLFGLRTHRGARSLALIGLGLFVGFLVPFTGAVFGSGDGTNGRCLYPGHVGWSLIVPALLVGTDARGRWRWLRPTLASLFVAWVTVGFVMAMRRFDRTLQVAHGVFEAAAAIDAQHPVALLDLPDREGPFLVARNAFPTALLPPFRDTPTGVMACLTEPDLAEGTIQGLATALPRLPALPAWRWQAASGQFVPGAWPTRARWRGAITVDADGTRCGGVRLVDVPDRVAASLMPGSWVELQAESRTVHGVCELSVHEAAAWEPILRPEPDHTDTGARWSYRGERGDFLFLLVGSEPCVVGLGSAGSLGIAEPAYVPIGFVDERGALSFPLPSEADVARRLQAVVARGLHVVLGEVHLLR